MKPVLWILGVMILLSSVSSFADSFTVVSNVNATFQIIPNVRATFEGEIFAPGISVGVTGHMPAPWFAIAPNIHYLPGAVASGSTGIFFETATGTVGSISGIGFDLGSIFLDAGSYVFPTNGKNFTVNLPATLESIVLGGCGDNGCLRQPILLNFKPGDLRLSYTYSDGQYYPQSGSFTTVSTVPEPATLGLVALGAAAVAYRKRKQKARELGLDAVEG
jgi:hypothetical protein